jgi:hypothetical protein
MVLNSQQAKRTPLCSKLDDNARAQLIARAALFDIHARIDADRVHLNLATQGLTLSLPLEVGLGRLIAELAEVLTPWVIFSPGKPPERVLLQYTDVKYRKLVAAWREAQKNDRA